MNISVNPTTAAIGQQAEAVAVDYLKKQGLQIVSTNYHCKMGEIDIICKNSRHVIFVEVRYRKSSFYGGALESLTSHKLLRVETYRSTLFNDAFLDKKLFFTL